MALKDIKVSIVGESAYSFGILFEKLDYTYRCKERKVTYSLYKDGSLIQSGESDIPNGLDAIQICVTPQNTTYFEVGLYTLKSELTWYHDAEGLNGTVETIDDLVFEIDNEAQWLTLITPTIRDSIWERVGVNGKYLRRYHIMCSHPMIITVSLSDLDTNVRCYLTNDTQWDTDDGVPLNPLPLNTSGQTCLVGTNITFTYLIDPNYSYYLWIRIDNINNQASGVLHIDIPAIKIVLHNNDKLYEESIEFYEGINFSTPIVYRFRIKSPYTGTLKISTPHGYGNNFDKIIHLYVYVDSVGNFDMELGEPQNILHWYSSSGGEGGEREYKITKDTEYYVWVRPRTLGEIGGRLLYIDFPTKDEDSLRPDKFSWTNKKESGKPFNLTAREWNNLTKNINEVRVYKELSNCSFTTAKSNYPFTAAMYKEVRAAIQGISGAGKDIDDVDVGYPITADCLNILVTSINDVE